MRQPYRLESITLRDVGVFENTHFDFPPIKSAEADAEKAEIHIFTGPNGCGKSTLLYALAAVFEYTFRSENLLISRCSKNSSTVDFSFASQASSIYLKNYIYTKNKGLGITGQMLEPSENEQLKKYQHFMVTMNGATDFAAFAYSGQSSSSDKFDVTAIEEITESPFEKALSFNTTVRPKIVAQWIALNRSNAALALQDGALEEIKNYDLALERISNFIKTVCDLDISFRLERNPRSVSLIINGEIVPFNVLPDGLKSIIGWVADLALRLEAIPWKESRDIFSQPIILFLDEVDIHLHPKWQRRILPAIQKLLPNAQVFVSTHSPFVVGSVEDAWVYRLPDPLRLVCRDPHIAEVITPTESAGGKSYQVILEEVFGVEEQFDVETEELLEQLRLARNGYLAGTQDDNELKKTVELLLAKNSEELEGIVQMEMRQVARRKPKGN
ncbi:hypothetical protein CWS43_14760 [Rahnella sp. AA]|uniref:AAA family ATPase n=1 Tax=Rahnella sp. AA TaxID=2057180 RepID=UPI000C330195|nr:AAA family ATPase [Rahnella sp. AA]PKE29995.1 hypothetical protein CWS43_14760 [Rahnella sp. AA]